MKVAVIGAGVCGLAALKISLDYGFDATCFEKSDKLGGLWNFKQDAKIGESTVMKTTIINTSKEMMAFSDFPPPADLPNFMHWTKVVQYYDMYADQFCLKPKMKFNSRVELIRRSADYETTGKWDVLYVENGEKKSDTFDGVMVANGHHAYPFLPEFEGREKFQGRVIHSHSYKDDAAFRDRRALVVGIGNSGGDIAVELSRAASQVYLSTRSGCWCVSRVGLFGLPFDLIMQTRLSNWLLQNAFSLTNSIVEFFVNMNFSHRLYGLQCRKRLFGQHPFVNDDLPNRILSGTLQIKPNIKKFLLNKSVQFEDGSIVENIDDVIMCTGYDITFELMEKGVITVNQNNELQLYKLMYPPHLAHSTMALIGVFQPWGAVMPIAEMQARFHCEMLANRVALPEAAAMLTEIEQYRERMRQRYGDSRRHTVQVDYISYMDDLARQFGAKPSVFKTMLRDPFFALRLALTPAAPYQYRLEGPHCWPGAREALRTVWSRSLAQLAVGAKNEKFPKEKMCKEKVHRRPDLFALWALVCLVVLIFVIFRLF